MPLTSCRDCGAEVGATAKVCPRCGAAAPGNAHPPGWLAKRFAVGCLGLFVLLMVAMQQCSGFAPPVRVAGPDRTPIPAPEGTCVHNRSDGRLLGRAIRFLPSLNNQDTTYTVAPVEESLGPEMDVTVPRNAVVRACQ